MKILPFVLDVEIFQDMCSSIYFFQHKPCSWFVFYPHPSSALFFFYARWHTNVRKIIFQRRSEDLQDMLVVAVPRFRNALFLLNR